MRALVFGPGDFSCVCCCFEHFCSEEHHICGEQESLLEQCITQVALKVEHVSYFSGEEGGSEEGGREKGRRTRRRTRRRRRRKKKRRRRWVVDLEWSRNGEVRRVKRRKRPEEHTDGTMRTSKQSFLSPSSIRWGFHQSCPQSEGMGLRSLSRSLHTWTARAPIITKIGITWPNPECNRRNDHYT